MLKKILFCSIMFFSISSNGETPEKRALAFATSTDGKETPAAAIITFENKTFYPVNNKSEASIDIESGYTDENKAIVRLETSSFMENEKCLLSLSLLREKINKGALFTGKESSLNPNFKEIKISVDYKDSRYDPSGKKDALVKFRITDYDNGIVYAEFEGKLYDEGQNSINISGKVMFRFEMKKENFIKRKDDLSNNMKEAANAI